MSDVVVRTPIPSDAKAIAGLLGELGYPADPKDIPRRLDAISLDPASTATWVAELKGAIVGMAGVKVFPAIHQSAPVAQLTILVVAESARGLGVGQHLVRMAEEWAREHGAWRISLTSGLHRGDAHKFYEHIGYERTGVRLSKVFGSKS